MSQISVNFCHISGSGSVGKWVFLAETPTNNFMVNFIPERVEFTRAALFTDAEIPTALNPAEIEVLQKLAAKISDNSRIKKSTKAVMLQVHSFLNAITGNDPAMVPGEKLAFLKNRIEAVLRPENLQMLKPCKNGNMVYHLPEGRFYFQLVAF